MESVMPKMRFSVFSAKKLSRRSRLLRTTSGPTRLIRSRPIDCDGGHARQTMLSRFFEEEKHEKKSFFFVPGI